MATKKNSTVTGRAVSTKKKRPGIHAKCKRSVSKRGKHWSKPYRGQGR